MTRWGKVRAVARFEFLSIVRSKGYLIGTFGMPVFLLAYGGIIGLVGIFEERQESRKVSVLGVLDEPGILALAGDVSASPIDAPPEALAALEAAGRSSALAGAIALLQNCVFRPVPDEAAAKAEVLAGRLEGYFRIPADYLDTGEIERTLSDKPVLGSKRASQALAHLIRDRLLAGRVTDAVAARVRRPVDNVRERTLLPDGRIQEGGEIGRIVRIILPIAFSALLLVSILVTAGGLIQATAVEKENKVVEVLLSSAGPDEILLGKLLGVGATGVLQVGVWFSMVFVAGIVFAASLAAFGVEVPWVAIAISIAFFVFAYLFYGSLMLGTGSIGTNQREVQQWAMVWSFFAAVPMVLMMALLHDPHGTLARILTWIPFSAPFTIVFRNALDPSGIAWWETAGGFLALVGATWLAIRGGARLFRVGILLTGARPKLREILRQARLRA